MIPFLHWAYWELNFRMAQQDIEAIRGNIALGNERAARQLARDAASCGLFVLYGPSQQEDCSPC